MTPVNSNQIYESAHPVFQKRKREIDQLSCEIQMLCKLRSTPKRTKTLKEAIGEIQTKKDSFPFAELPVEIQSYCLQFNMDSFPQISLVSRNFYNFIQYPYFFSEWFHSVKQAFPEKFCAWNQYCKNGSLKRKSEILGLDFFTFLHRFQKKRWPIQFTYDRGDLSAKKFIECEKVIEDWNLVLTCQSIAEISVERIASECTIEELQDEASELRTALQEDDSLCLSVRKLYLNGWAVSELPKEILLMKNIDQLAIFKSKLWYIPESIENLKNISLLKLYENKLRYLPPALFKIKSIAHANFSKNKIGSLPDTFVEYSKLFHLNLSHNRLKNLPLSLANTKLRTLFLSYNQLKNIPEVVGQLKNLQRLQIKNLQANTVSHDLLPESLRKLYLKSVVYTWKKKYRI